MAMPNTQSLQLTSAKYCSNQPMAIAVDISIEAEVVCLTSLKQICYELYSLVWAQFCVCNICCLSPVMPVNH